MKRRFRGRFKYVFASGWKMTDRNKYKTLAGARAWAKAHNLSPDTKKSEKIVRIIKVKRKRR